MRNLKKVVSALVVMTMIFAIIVPAFANTYSYESQATKLNQLGLLDGVSSDSFDAGLGMSLDRQTGVALLVKLFGKKSQALVLSESEIGSILAGKYDDANKIASWAKPYVAYATKEQMIEGRTDGNFDPATNLKGKDLATIILRQLGYPTTGSAYNIAAATLKEKGGLTEAEASKFAEKSLIRDDMVGIAFGALGATNSAGKQLIVTLVDAGVVTAEKATTAGFTVKTISSIAASTDVEVTLGGTPVLPTTVTATYSDATTGSVAVTWAAVDTTTAGTKTIAGTVQGFAAGTSIKVIVKNPALAVSSVSALNAKQVQVAFNRTVDKTTAETGTNYEIYNEGKTTKLPNLTSVLQADGKSVIVTIDKEEASATFATSVLTNTSNAKVVVKTGVKDADGTALAAEYTKTDVAFSDVARPTVASVVQTGPMELKVNFSEPVKNGSVAANFKVDNGSYIVATAVNDVDDKYVTLTLGGALTNGSHTLTLNPLTDSTTPLCDFVGINAQQAGDTAFTIAVDTAAPTATIKTISQTSVTYLFNKPINNAQNANVAYRHSVNGTQYQVLGSSANVTVNTDKTEVTVNFNAAGVPLPTGNANLYISYISDTGTKIIDNFSNTFVAATFTSTVTADTTKPTVTAVVVSSSNTQIDVTASETVDGAATASNYTLKDSSSNDVEFAVAATATTNVYRITTTAAMSGTYTLTVANLADKAITPNTMDAYTTTLTVADTIAPTVATELNVTDATPNYYVQGDTKQCRVYFTEAMNTTDLSTLTKYQDASATPKNPTVATPASDGKSVSLTFADAITGPISMVQMRDTTGNVMASLVTSLDAATATNIGLDTTVTNNVIAESTTSVKIYLNSLITSISASDFEVHNGTEWVKGTVTNQTVSGKTVLTITLPSANALPTNIWDTATIPQVRTTDGNAATGTKNAYGIPVQIAATNIVDKVVPVLATTNPLTTLDVDGNGKIDHIRVVFGEDIAVSSLSYDKFTVAGYTVTDAYPSDTAPTSATARPAGVGDSDVVYVTVEEKTVTDSTVLPNITIASGIKDARGNVFAGQAATAPVKGT